MTREQCEELLFAIQEAYPGRATFTETSIGLWYELLGDLPAVIAAQAVKGLIQRSKWPPSIAEIRAEAAELIDPIPSAEDAWQRVVDVARGITPYQSGGEVDKLDPLTRRAVMVMGGIEAVAYADNGLAVGREFRRVYDSLREQEIARRQRAEGLGVQSVMALPGDQGGR